MTPPQKWPIKNNNLLCLTGNTDVHVVVYTCIIINFRHTTVFTPHWNWFVIFCPSRCGDYSLVIC